MPQTRRAENATSERMPQRSIIVIGAGMAGLAAASRLAARGADIHVLEKERRPGGRVVTEEVGGVAIDTGAQILANFCTHALGLIHDAGLDESLLNITGSNGFVRDGHLYELPSAPSALLTPLLSPTSKLKLLKVLWPTLLNWRRLDVHDFPRASALDTRSVAAYADAELSDEVLSNLIGPLLAGILYYSPEHTSQALLFLMLKAAIGLRLYTLRGGLGRLPEEMAARLSVSYSTEVGHIESAGEAGYRIQARADGADCELTADGIICAIPATHVPTLFSDLSHQQRAFFSSIGYSSTVALAVALPAPLKTHLYDVFWTAGETQYLAAATFHSAQSTSRTPPEANVIELFSSHLGAQQLLGQDDQAIHDLLWAEFQRLRIWDHVGDEHTSFSVRRWPQALPMFDVGHFRRLAAFEHDEIETGAISFAGDYLGGPFIEGAITSGISAADRLLIRLNEKSLMER